jgi:hypothetical protein
MKGFSRLLFAPILAAVLLLACTPTSAAHRGGGSAYDGFGVWRSTLCAGTAVLCA